MNTETVAEARIPSQPGKTLDWVATEIQSDLYRIRTCANAIADAVDCSAESVTATALGDVFNLSELIRMVIEASLLRAEQLEIATSGMPIRGDA